MPLSQGTAGLGADEEVIVEAEDNESEDTQEDDSSSSIGSSDDEHSHSTRIAQGLLDDADEDDTKDDSDEVTGLADGFFTRRIICYFGRQELIPLTELIHFQRPSASDSETPSGRPGTDVDYF